MNLLLDWFETFAKIIIKPLPKTFLEEAEKAQGKTSSAIAWVVSVVITFNAFLLLSNQFKYPADIIISEILIYPIVFLFYVFCLHSISYRLSHRQKYCYDELLYLITSIFVPFTIAASIITFFVPDLRAYLGRAIILYEVVLIYIAIKAITGLNGWSAFLTVFLAQY